jgi:hypothetical protein
LIDAGHSTMWDRNRGKRLQVQYRTAVAVFCNDVGRLCRPVGFRK